MIKGSSHDPSLGSGAVFGGSFVESSLDGLCSNRASRGGALSKYFLACMHIDHGRLRMVSRVEQGNAFVDGVLDNFMGLAGLV